MRGLSTNRTSEHLGMPTRLPGARFFFSNTRFITIGFTGDKITGFTTSDYGKVVRCAWSGEGPDGEEIILFENAQQVLSGQRPFSLDLAEDAFA